jgi:ureidoacrylate peracid hydrolase
MPRMKERVTIPARPAAIDVDLRTTALMVVDMQNAYLSKGGYYDLFGLDISGAPELIKRVNAVIGASRGVGMPVVFFQNGFAADLHDAGGPDSPNWHKSNALRLMRERKELAGRLLTKGSWDYALAEDIKPEPRDLIVQKPRYSGFWGTNLDMLLRARGIRSLVFTGIASNVCVESTLRDAFFLEYFPILVDDASLQAGSRAVHEAVLYNVATFFGWVTTTDRYVTALSAGQ